MTLLDLKPKTLNQIPPGGLSRKAPAEEDERQDAKAPKVLLSLGLGFKE